MQAHSLLWHYLWLAPHAFQAAILVVMIRRRLLHDFPVFFTYTAWSATLGLVLFILDHLSSVSPALYWQADWVEMIGSIILRFGVVWEIFAQIFKPYPAIWEVGKLVFRWAAVVLLLVGVAVAVYSPAPQVPWIISGALVIDRAISIIQCGLLLFLFLFSSYFGLSWRSYVFGIAAGLGIFATVQLIASSIWLQSSPYSPTDIFSFVKTATFHCCVLIWLFYLVTKEPARRPVAELPHNDLEVWDRELARMLHS